MDFLYRAAYLVESLCNVALVFVFYMLLRSTRRDLVLLTAFFGLVVGNTTYIVTPDISARNGIIHVVDAVVLPVDLGL